MGIVATLDPEPLTDAEKEQFGEKIQRMKIGMMTLETWERTTGKTKDDLAVFIKDNFQSCLSSNRK
jgi:hypothetical protein